MAEGPTRAAGVRGLLWANDRSLQSTLVATVFLSALGAADCGKCSAERPGTVDPWLHCIRA